MKNQRRREILRILESSSPVSVKELVERFSVTPATIRRDLTYLENAKLITRLRGEAHLATNNVVPAFELRNTIAAEEKMLIAKAASQLIEEGDSIIIDSGTTALSLATTLVNYKKLTVVTNSIPVTYALANTDVTVLLSNGILHGNTMCLIGPETEQYFKQIRVSKLFLGTSGIRGSEGLTTFTPFQCSLKKQMMKAAKKVYALVDSNKFSKTGIYLFADFSQIDGLIVSKPIENEDLLKRLKSLGTEIIIAQNSNDSSDE
jgi:DeoR family fructose operon transcriptional repressor